MATSSRVSLRPADAGYFWLFLAISGHLRLADHRGLARN
jgi:hypothetical protein